MKNMHRVFLAVNLPPDISERLYGARDSWPDLPANWTHLENLHITLLFIGNATDQEVGDICQAARDVAKRHEPFTLRLSRVCFGPLPVAAGRPPRMVWAVGESSPELNRVQKDLQDAFCSDEAFGDAEFTPHVTLARIRQNELRLMEQEEMPSIDEPMALEFVVESIDVMESELKRGGPVYTVLESAALGEDNNVPPPDGDNDEEDI